jgi:hypothetical protein
MIARRTVILIGALTLATVVAAAVAVTDRVGETRTTVDAVPIYPDLELRTDDVRQVRVVRADDSATGTVTLTQTGDGWMLEERDGYPARTDLVRKLLFDLGRLELTERKTADPGRFDRLSLTDVAQQGSKASRIVVTTAQGDTLVDLHVGRTRQSPTGGKSMVYVRRTDEEQTWLAEGDIDLRGAPAQWVMREVVNIPKNTITTVVLTAPDGSVLWLERTGVTDFGIVELPTSRKVQSQYTVNNAATLIDKMLFDEVRTAEGLAFDGREGEVVFTTDDGLTLTLDLAADPDGASLPWVRVTVAIDEAAPEEAKERGLAARAQTAGWAYRLSSYDTTRLRATLESLTQPAEGS